MSTAAVTRCWKHSLLNSMFVTAEQHWLGTAKPKNVFRSTLTLCTKLLWNFKSFLFSRIFCWRTIWLTIWLIASDKHSSEMAKTTGLIFSLILVTLLRDGPFRQSQQLQCLYHGSTKAYLCSPMFSIPFSPTALVMISSSAILCLKRSVKC